MLLESLNIPLSFGFNFTFTLPLVHMHKKVGLGLSGIWLHWKYIFLCTYVNYFRLFSNFAFESLKFANYVKKKI